MKPKITTIGCGVSGLTTGIVLLEAGFPVEIVTAAMPADTVSARAAAIWFPFQIGPADLANAWSKHAYSVFEALSNDPQTGVFMRPTLELIAQESDAWWLDALPANAIRRARADELPAGFALGYVMEVPTIETPIYLAYLQRRFAAAGGTITLQAITDIADFINNPFIEFARIVKPPKKQVQRNLKSAGLAGIYPRLVAVFILFSRVW